MFLTSAWACSNRASSSDMATPSSGQRRTVPAVTLHLTHDQARRIAVRAQLLEGSRLDDLLAVVRHLTLLQVDQTAAVAPSAELVAWSRLGAAYTSEMLADARAG